MSEALRDSGLGTAADNPAQVVTIQTRASLASLREAGHIAPGALPGSWQVVNWDAFNRVATYSLEGPP